MYRATQAFLLACYSFAREDRNCEYKSKFELSAHGEPRRTQYDNWEAHLYCRYLRGSAPEAPAASAKIAAYSGGMKDTRDLLFGGQ